MECPNQTLQPVDVVRVLDALLLESCASNLIIWSHTKNGLYSVRLDVAFFVMKLLRNLGLRCKGSGTVCGILRSHPWWNLKVGYWQDLVGSYQRLLYFCGEFSLDL